jgi:Protein of unknown function (DUF3489)
MARPNLRRPGVEIDPEFVIWPGWRARLRVLKMPLRSEGATVAQAAEAAGWAHYNVRGFFAGLKKHGVPVSVLERVRQVWPGKGSAHVIRSMPIIIIMVPVCRFPC